MTALVIFLRINIYEHLLTAIRYKKQSTNSLTPVHIAERSGHSMTKRLEQVHGI